MGAQYTFSTALDPLETFLPSYININGVGNVHLPISIKDLQRLVYVAAYIACGQGCNKIVNFTYHYGVFLSGEEVFISTDSGLSKTVDCWMNTALYHAGIDGKAIKARSSFKRLLIYPTGGYCMQQVHLPEEAGHFATLRLQLPVEDGYSGGVLTVEDGRNCIKIDHSRDSDSLFYLTVTHVQSELGIREVTAGSRVELVFNILWTPPTPSFYPDVREISLFLATLSKLHRDISRWCERNDQDGAVKMIMIRLDKAYDPETQSFSSLASPDRLVAYLFRALDMVEVHLAYLTRKTKVIAVDDGIVRSGGVALRIVQTVSTQHFATHWVDVNDRTIRLSTLDVDFQVQDIEALIEPSCTANRMLVKSHDSLRTVLELEHNRNVLVLWPKSKSFNVTLRHRFDYLLHLLEMEEDHKNSLEMVRSILSYENEWPKTELNICKMLNICRRLQASDETLRLLDMLASYSIGVCSRNVGDLIAQIDSEVLGWSVCRSAVKKLLDVNPILNLRNFVSFAENLLIRASFDAFRFVADRTLDFFSQSDNNDSICRETRAACVKLLILLAEHSLALSSIRGTQFLDSFCRWSPANQCNLITDLEDVWTSQPEKSRLLFTSLSTCFVESISPSVSSGLLIDYFSMLLSIHDRGLSVVDAFARIFNHQPNCFPNDFLRNLVPTFEEIDAPREFFIHVLNARFSELQSEIVRGEANKWEQKEARFPAGDQFSEVVSFLHSNERATRTEPIFGSVRKAREFANEYFGTIDECLKLGYCAVATVNSSGKKSRVSLVKTLHLHKAKQAALKEELEKLINKLSAFGFAPPSSNLTAQLANEEVSEDSSTVASEVSVSCRVVTRSRSRKAQVEEIQ